MISKKRAKKLLQRTAQSGYTWKKICRIHRKRMRLTVLICAVNERFFLGSKLSTAGILFARVWHEHDADPQDSQICKNSVQTLLPSWFQIIILQSGFSICGLGLEQARPITLRQIWSVSRYKNYPRRTAAQEEEGRGKLELLSRWESATPLPSYIWYMQK